MSHSMSLFVYLQGVRVLIALGVKKYKKDLYKFKIEVQKWREIINIEYKPFIMYIEDRIPLFW